ncbi:MAG: hypothetical protein ACYCO4_02155 [Sulfobacillus sp.]
MGYQPLEDDPPDDPLEEPLPDEELPEELLLGGAVLAPELLPDDWLE